MSKPLKHARLFAPVLIGLLLAASLWKPEPRGELLAAPAADACTSITPASMTAYARTIEQALKYAQKDARANGETGAYAVAAVNSRDLLDRSRKRIEEGAARLQGADPRVTTYAEAGMVKENFRSTLEWMPQAAHWALVSAIYHKSTDARAAFEGTVTALAEGQRLFAESGRCYVGGYL